MMTVASGFYTDLPLSATSRASARPDRSVRLCAALTEIRSRLPPAGTVGGLSAGTQKPASNSLADAAIVSVAPPMITGMI